MRQGVLRNLSTVVVRRGITDITVQPLRIHLPFLCGCNTPCGFCNRTNIASGAGRGALLLLLTNHFAPANRIRKTYSTSRSTTKEQQHCRSSKQLIKSNTGT